VAILVQFLRWSDLDPTGRSFDPNLARDAAEECLARALGDNVTGDREELEASLDRALLAKYGAWAAGWRWAASEPGGGGPIRAWCCARDSLLRSDDPGPKASVDRVVGALQEWRNFLGELARIFRTLRDADAGVPIQQAVEHAAARLLPVVLERTSAEDAWYTTFVRVLSWYLESCGHSGEKVREAVADVVSGRFSSWVAPDDATGLETYRDLGQEVALSLQAPEDRRDALSAWLAIRDAAFTCPPGSPSRDPVQSDAHRRYIDGPERARDPLRSRNMAAALEVCRASALQGEPITFGRLASWQALVLGEERVEFRTADAYAKDGRERYPIAPDTRTQFEKALSQANEPTTPLAVRAARAYLDVCFFHPFDDRNGRSARLALDHTLTKEGLALPSVEPLFVVGRAADDSHGARCFASVLDHLTGPPAALRR